MYVVAEDLQAIRDMLDGKLPTRPARDRLAAKVPAAVERIERAA